MRQFLVESNSNGVRTPACVAFLRALAVEGAIVKKGKKRKISDLKNEVPLVFDYLYDYHIVGTDTIRPKDRKPLLLDRNQMSAPWSWWVAKSNTWHNNALPEQVAYLEYIEAKKAKREANKLERLTDPVKRAKYEAAKLARESWPSAISAPVRIDDFTAIPLTDKQSLIDEGKAMKHCVGGYSRHCSKGTTRIFNLSATDKRVATVELSRSHKNWTVAQVRGVANSDPGNKAKSVAAQLAKLYTQASI